MKRPHVWHCVNTFIRPRSVRLLSSLFLFTRGNPIFFYDYVFFSHYLRVYDFFFSLFKFRFFFFLLSRHLHGYLKYYTDSVPTAREERGDNNHSLRRERGHTCIIISLNRSLVQRLAYSRIGNNINIGTGIIRYTDLLRSRPRLNRIPDIIYPGTSTHSPWPVTEDTTAAIRLYDQLFVGTYIILLLSICYYAPRRYAFIILYILCKKKNIIIRLCVPTYQAAIIKILLLLV